MFFVYFLKSLKSGKSYVGVTSKGVEKRLEQHNLGSNIWTKNNRPFNLLYYESYHCREDAFSRERFYKSGVGKKIKKLIIDGLSIGE